MSISQKRPLELEALVVITEILTGRLPFLEKCESVLAVLADFTESDLVVLREYEPENHRLDLVAHFFNRRHGEEFQVPLSLAAGMTTKSAETGSPMVVLDNDAVAAWHRGYGALGMNSALAFPIYIEGKLFGTLGFGSRNSDQYQEEMVRAVAAITSVVGMIIDKAALIDTNEVEAIIGRIISGPLVGPEVCGRNCEADRLQSPNFKFDRPSRKYVCGRISIWP